MSTELVIPASATAITAQWLTDALRSVGRLEADVSVVAVALEPIGEVVGVFGTVHRLRPTYSGPSAAAPPTMVAKFPTEVPENRAVGTVLGMYSREIFALREVVANTPTINAAQIVYADMDPEAGLFALIIDEVTGATVGDQVAGLTQRQTCTALTALANLHARWWRNDIANSEWLPDSTHPVQRQVVNDIMQQATPAVAALKRDLLGDEAIAIGERVAAQFLDIVDLVGAHAVTFTHTDARAVNMFFNEEGDEVTLIDWQLCLWSTPMQDVHYLLSSSVARSNWDDWGMDALHHYLGALHAAGVDEYGWDDLWRDFRLASLFGLVSPASTVGTFDMGNELGQQIADVWLQRTWQLPALIGAQELLR
jgi:hypothetical protein